VSELLALWRCHLTQGTCVANQVCMCVELYAVSEAVPGFGRALLTKLVRRLPCNASTPDTSTCKPTLLIHTEHSPQNRATFTAELAKVSQAQAYN
jgi:hypothetical protein